MHECKNFTTEIKTKCVKLVAKKYRVHWQRNKAKTCKEINGASVQTCWTFPERIFSLVWTMPFAVFFNNILIALLFVFFYKTCTWMYKFSLKVFLPSSASDKNWIVMASMPKKNSEIWNVSRNVSQLKFFRISEGLSKSYCSFVRFSTEGCLWSYWNILIFRPLKVEMHWSAVMAFAQSPSLSNNPKILTNYWIFTELSPVNRQLEILFFLNLPSIPNMNDKVSISYWVFVCLPTE